MRLSSSFFDCAESGLIVSFGSQYNRELSLAILDISRRLENKGLPGLRESIPALSSLTVFYDPLSLSREHLIETIEDLCADDISSSHSSRLWNIPVVYGGAEGPDLDEAAASADIPAEELVNLHAGQDYHVYMLGFLPGFAYLGDLPPKLRLPRRETPRARVPAGSVAIASDMTAIYPLESPGGWHLIGSTPLVLWDLSRSEEPLLKPGDRVRFNPISANDANSLRVKIADGWQPRPTEAA
jgi:KipI family sensor histidine kinase inhibitor